MNKKIHDIQFGKRKMRKSGIDIVGNIPWGTHLCQFYETGRDLTDILVPYFKAGLKNNEFCLWVTSSPLSKAEAEKALKKAIPGFDRYVKKGQIEIIPHTQWYLKDDGFKLKRVLKGWTDKLEQALAQGYDGMRVEGNLAWLGRKDWKNFIEYEEEINKVIGNLRMIVVCSYRLSKCEALDMVDVVNNHHFALIRRDGKWNVLENVYHRFTRQVMKATKEELALVVEASLDAIVAVDEAGNISLFNPAAEELFQYGLDEILFQPVRVLLRDDASEIHHKRLGRFLRKGIGRCGHIGRRTEFTFRRKDGSLFDGELSMTGARVGGKRMIVVSIRDISDRRRVEEVLRENEVKFRNLIETSPDVVWEINPGGIFTYVSPRSLDVLGYAPEEMVGKPIFSFTSYMFAPIFEDIFVSHRQKNKQINVFEVLANHRDGHQLILEIRAVEVKDSEGRLIGFRGVTRDITERKRAEEAIGASEERFKQLFEHMTSGVAVYEAVDEGTDFVFRGFNSAAERIECLKRSEVIGKRVTERFPGVKEFGIFETFQRVWRTAQAEYSLSHLYKDDRDPGSWRDCWVYKLPSGEVVAVYNDITERKRAEEMLRSSEEKFSKAFGLSPVAVFITTLKEGRFIEINRTGMDMVGYESDEIVGRTVKELGLWNDLNDRATLLERLQKEGVVRDMETSLRRKSGEVFSAIISSDTVDIGDQRFLLSTCTDITERKRAEEALRRSEERWRSLVTAIPDYVSLLDKNGNLLFLNHYAEGFTEKEVIGSSVYQYLEKESVEIFRNNVKACLETRQIQKFEHSALGDKGLMRIYEDYAVPVIENNAVVNVMIISRDITERKWAEEKLRSSEEGYRTVFENTGTAMVLFSEDEKVELANNRFFDLFGYSREESKNIDWLDLIHPHDHDMVKYHRQLRVKSLEQSVKTYEIMVMPKSGDPKEVIVNVCLIPGTLKSLVSFLDVTERKRVEEALIESEEKYRNLVENLSDSVVLIDHEGKVKFANRYTEKLTGYTMEEGIGMNVMEITPSEYWQKSLEMLENVVEGKTVAFFESMIKRKDGALIHVESGGKAILKDGKVSSIQIVTRDITARKRAEENANRRNRELKALNEVSFSTGSTLELHEVLDRALDKMLEVSGVGAGSIYLMDSREEKIDLVTYRGISEKFADSVRSFKLGQSLCGLAAQSGEAVISNNLGEDKRVTSSLVSEGKFCSMASIPFKFKGKVLGVLNIGSHKPHTFSAEEVQLLSIFSNQISVAIENAQLYASIRNELSERKRIEEDLKLSEEKYRSIFNNAQMSLFRIRITDGKMVECNDLCAEMFGYKSREECLRDYSVYRHFSNPDDRRQLLKQLIRSGEARGFEARGIKVDGSPLWVNYSVKMIPGTEYMEGMSIDITEPTRLQEEKNAIAERWSRFSNAAQDLYFIFDQDLTLVDFNRALSPELAERFSRREAIGKKLTEISPAIRESDMLDKYLEVLKTGKPFHQSRYKISVSIGEFRYVSMDIFKVGDGLGMILHDVTEQIQAEEMIKNASTEWRTTFDSIPDMIMVQDLDCRILRANRAMANFLGLSFSEIIGQQCFRLVHKTGAPPEYCRQSRAIAEKRSFAYEVHSDRFERDYLVTVTPILDAEQKCSGTVHMTRDITEAIKLQKRLKESEKMAVIGEIAGNIAHEIKNPLFAISSGIEILHDHLKLGGAQKETLEIILRETVRMDYLVRQLLDYGRHRALNEIALAPVDMREVMDEVMALNSGLLQINGIRVEKKMPPDLPSVMAEKGEMIQVFINLLQNAIEVSKKGDVIEIEARADNNKKTLIISMKDRGPGIPKEMKEKIFEIFFTTKKGSYGMGLAISRRIILDHGGDIRVESEPGKGANFIVELPIK